jgi:hypothetical protein
MVKSRWLVAAAAAALSALPVSAHAERATKACLPISVATTRGVFTYDVRIEGRPMACSVARAVLRDAADWPPDADEGRAAHGWNCVVGQSRASWALSCGRGHRLVRAYGPHREHDAFVIAEARLRMGALAPSTLQGLAARRWRGRRCAPRTKELEVDYARADGAALTVVEGRPYGCGNFGVAPQLAIWRVHGATARLLEFCAPTGCSRLTGDYVLDWRERGLEISLVTHRLEQRELLALARSMRPVPA